MGTGLLRGARAPGLLVLAWALTACGGTSIFRSAVPAPTGLIALPSSQALVVQLSWNVEPEATAGFEVWRSQNGNDQQIASTFTPSYTDDTPPAGAQLSYTVRAVDSDGAGVGSSPVIAVTIPGAPTAIAALTTATTRITIGWTEAAGATGGDTVSVVGADGVSFNGTATGATFTADNLNPNTSYLFSVTAHDTTGAGPSATALLTTLVNGPGGGSGGGSAGGNGGGSGGGSAGGNGGGSGGGSAGGNGGGSGGGSAGGIGGGSGGGSAGGIGGGSGGGSAGGIGGGSGGGSAGGIGGGSGGGSAGGIGGGSGGGSPLTCAGLGGLGIAANIATLYSATSGGTYSPFEPAGLSVVVPSDWVEFDSSGSTSLFGIASTVWAVTSAPSGANNALTDPSSAQAYLQISQVGDYTIALTITDASSCTATATVTVHAVAVAQYPKVTVTLTWPETCGDLDLHYLAPSDVFCSTTDLNYSDPTPDWGCATSGCGHEEDPGGLYPDGTASDDGSFGNDAQWGSGPEEVTHDAPFDATSAAPYQVWVYYYSATVGNGVTQPTPCTATHPEIAIKEGDTTIATYSLSAGMTTGQAWHAANIVVSNSGSSVSTSSGSSTAAAVASCQGGGT